jgi:hypothetical protein|tara:strand:- start:8745 stop:9575 length:831 start_codon:yes stop_codon:yes gene_type:complete
MKKLIIVNNYPAHYEIIESVIVKCNYILNIDLFEKLNIYLSIYHCPFFKKYIKNKYPNIKFQKIFNYDYFINCTVYDKDFKYLDKDNKNKKYIAHELTPRLKENPNILFLTPFLSNRFLEADILPFSFNKIKTKIPVYIIQGNLNQKRRNYDLLKKILSQNYKYDFKIKLIGRGDLPQSLIKYKEKIILKNNLNFIDFHKEFLNGYCILPLISKNSNPNYYKKKLTSTINYAKGYKLKCLIDKDLQDIYNLEDVEIYNDIQYINYAFEKTLEKFYL